MAVHIKFRSCSGIVDAKLYFLHFQARNSTVTSPGGPTL